MLFHIVGARHASPGAAPAQETGCRFAVPAIVGEGHAPPGDALTVRTSHRQNGKRFRLVIARSKATWQSREGTSSSCKVSIKTHRPIASAAAFPAQPLAALPPYGCGVPFTGSKRLWQSQVVERHRRTCKGFELSCEEANGRRGNLAVPGRITGHSRRKRNCLHEIPTSLRSSE